LTSARAAGAPFAERVADLERVLRDELQAACGTPFSPPATPTAAPPPRPAPRPRRHRRSPAGDRARRRCPADSLPIKQQLDLIEDQARSLRAVVDRTSSRHLDQLHRDQLTHIDRTIDANELWSASAQGRPVTTTALAETAAILQQHVGQTPRLPGDGHLEGPQFYELLEPVVELLHGG
jgi:hypothetical protein